MIDLIKNKIVFEEHKLEFQKKFIDNKKLSENPFKREFIYFLAFEYDFILFDFFLDSIKNNLKILDLPYFIYYSVIPTPDEYFNSYGIYSTIKIWDYNTDKEVSEFLMAGNSVLYSVDSITLFTKSNEWAIIGSMDLEIAIVGFTTKDSKDSFLKSFGENKDIFFSVKEIIEQYENIQIVGSNIKNEYASLLKNYK